MSSEDMSSEDVSSEDVSCEDVSSEDVSSEDVSSEDVSNEDMTQAVFFYWCPDYLSCPVSAIQMNWATCPIWAAIKKSGLSTVAHLLLVSLIACSNPFK